MQKLLLLALALAVAGCNAVAPAGTPTPPSCAVHQRLPHADIDIREHDTYITVRNAEGVHLEWYAAGVTGADNVYTWAGPDHIALGCLDGLVVTETAFTAR